MVKKTLLGVSGLPGSFSEEAAFIYSKRENISPDLVFLTDMEGVLAALKQHEIDIGIFPVVNIHGGLVKPAFAAMGKHLFDAFDELWLDVKQCLLVLPGKVLSDITAVVSHPQALAQCKNYLKNTLPQAELIPWIDTAKAAKDLHDGTTSDTTAVLAPARSASIYHLEILAKDIQDNHPNLTAFILVKRHL